MAIFCATNTSLARGSIGASALPQGRDFYRFRVKKFTTLDVTPEEVHQIGLAEVDRIRQEMTQVIDQVGFAGDFAAFLEHLRSDPKFYAETDEQLLKEASYILKRIDGRLPELFGQLPPHPMDCARFPILSPLARLPPTTCAPQATARAPGILI